MAQIARRDVARKTKGGGGGKRTVVQVRRRPVGPSVAFVATPPVRTASPVYDYNYCSATPPPPAQFPLPTYFRSSRFEGEQQCLHDYRQSLLVLPGLDRTSHSRIKMK